MKNKSLSLLLLSVTTVTILIACKKGSDTPNNPLLGSWALVSMNSTYRNSSEYIDGADLKSTSNSVISISNPTGTFSFGGNNNVNTTNLSYTWTGSGAAVSYKNGVIQDSTALSFLHDFKDTSVSNTYQLIGADSVYFPNGTYISYFLSSVLATKPIGARYSTDGNTLTFTTFVDSVAYDQIFTNIIDTVHTYMLVKTVLQKQ